ncbi:hypothetical protein CVT26_012689, partial [Gymnopilus dilepis]
SNTFASSIAAWAAHVQPGSPAPRSPHRRPSVTSTTTTSSRRPSITRPTRRPSISISHSRAPSGSFIHLIDTPTRTQTHTHTHSTPSVANFDLTGLGYTSVFVHFPKTPSTPSPLLRQYQQTYRAGAPVPPKAAAREPLSANPAFAHIPIPPVPEDTPSRPAKKTGMKRFRSLSILRPKGKGSKGRDTNPAAPASPTKTALSTKSTKSAKPSKPSTATPKPKTPKLKPTPSDSAASIANRKRAKYAYVRPPPPLANELAMMQFADGGSLESHAKRVMEAQAKAAAGTTGLGAGAGAGVYVGVGDVYRDGKGGIWWDADEEMEYAHLLEGDMRDGDVTREDWEEFGVGPDAGEPLSPFFASTQHPTTALPPHPTTSNKENLSPTLPPTRRSSSSLSTLDSDLDPTYLLPLPENADPRLLPIDDRALASRRIGGPGMSVLSLPARARRRERHLCKPGFLVDVRAFGCEAGAGSPERGELNSPGGAEGGSKPRGKARRRPAPLKLASSNQVVVVVRRPSQVAAQLQAESSALSPALSPNLTPAPALAAAPAPAPMALALIPSPLTLEKTRREFIEDSFEPLVPSPSLVPAPAPFPSPAPAHAHVYGQTPTQRPNLTNPAIGASVLSLSGSSKPAVKRTGVRGLFGLGRRGD